MEIFVKIGLTLVAALLAISIHEYPKAILATFLGDNTPRVQGKVSFNPFKHMDPIGFILLVTQGVGWSYPVNFDAQNFKDRKRGTLFVSLIGIIVSVAVAIAILTMNKFFGNNPLSIVGYSIYYKFFTDRLLINCLSIAVFNLIPVPPLSITKIIEVSSPRMYFKLLQYERMIHMGVFLLYFTGIIPFFVKAISTVFVRVFG